MMKDLHGRKKLAVELFSRGKITTSEAANIAKLSVGEMMDIMTKRGIDSGTGLEDVRESLKNALKYVK